ncbi:hypothetical protein GWN65_00075 [Candidatus Bathyarchaeota archaeon]|nr:hypothetical protein [Candidatus Bathyarchaeota archaeon]NIV43311.1 hypothetical protein [Candidatus Bathyarchaeota archaeon]
MTKPQRFSLDVNGTTQLCPKGQEVGKRYMAAGKIPVISCEGGCIRGEIARLAANIVSKEEPFRRSCHGELLTVPNSAIAQWTMNANKVVVIDGCFLHCHGRILQNIIDDDALEVFDALSNYKKYTDLFDIDEVPEAERNQVAQDVATWVLANLRAKGL